MKCNLPLKALMLFALSLFIFSAPVVADNTVIDMDNFRSGDLVVDGFKLKGQTTLEIEAVGAAVNDDDMYAYAWIIESETREPVWVMHEEETRRYKKSKYKFKRHFEEELVLPEGSYEAYFFAGRPYMAQVNFDYGDIVDLSDVSDLLGIIFDDITDDKFEFYSADPEDLFFTIRAPEGSFTKFNPTDLDEPIVDFSRASDDYDNMQQGFTLKKDMNLHLVFIGEFISKHKMFVDYAYVINADSREKVWEPDKWNSSWAGGGRKNRGFNDIIELPAGDYVAVYRGDDSHAFGSWNVNPPYDPLHYGLAIYANDKDDRKYVTDFRDNYKEPIVLEMTKIRDEEFVQKGFTLKEKTNLRIFALGEMSFSDDLVDFGWIEDLSTGEIVWSMTDYNTEYAGGARKNRKFDGVVTLSKGDYAVYYVTDDSHAYRDWNDTRPLDPEMWGISIFGTGKNFDPKSIPVFDELPKNENFLVQLIGIGDHERVRERFTIDKPTKIKIIALGEGSGGDMYDYGWIENDDTGEIIWEMTYRKTDYAGGAKKNRIVETEIMLEPGKYKAYYRTDGSHSFPNFNASRPDNPQKWGLSIFKP